MNALTNNACLCLFTGCKHNHGVMLLLIFPACKIKGGSQLAQRSGCHFSWVTGKVLGNRSQSL